MCGIVGVFNHSLAATELYDGLIHVQHRGQDAAGILTCATSFHKVCGKGLVRDIFTDDNMRQLNGNIGIAHVRYPTSGANNYEEIQPFWINSPYGIAIAHNGNLINQDELSQELQQKYHRHLNTSNDSEILLNVLANSFDLTKNNNSTSFFELLCDAISNLHNSVVGAYTVVGILVNRGLIAFRDPNGIRPLVYGRRPAPNGKYDYIFASEAAMFHSLGYTKIGDVKPGEVILVDKDGNLFQRVIAPSQFTPCIFEYVYFARPDSMLDDINVYRARLRMGENLALSWQKNFPDILPDVVIPVPATSNTAALAFANQLNVRYSEGLYKNPFIGRTFIMPDQLQRQRSVRYKLSPQAIEIRDKKVLLLDDSIVRGTTSREIVAMVKECQPRAVYLVTTCPEVKFPCFYGIDMPTRSELIAANKSADEIKKFLGVDELLYQTIDDLIEAVTRKGKHCIDTPCIACLSGKYPTCGVTSKIMQKLENKRNQQREINHA